MSILFVFSSDLMHYYISGKSCTHFCPDFFHLMNLFIFPKIILHNRVWSFTFSFFLRFFQFIQERMDLLISVWLIFLALRLFLVFLLFSPVFLISSPVYLEELLSFLVSPWSYVKKKYKLNMPFLRLAYPARASAFSSNAA